MLLTEKARVFATAAHAAIDQRRKYTGEPYIVHPAAVAGLVERTGAIPEIVAAAWLHDVVEDTKVALTTIDCEFGSTVAAYVGWLTDVSTPADGNRVTRKQLDLAHIARAAHPAHTIKLADLIDNTSTIVQHDRSFAKVYLREKQALLKVLVGGDGELFKQAYIMVEQHLKELG